MPVQKDFFEQEKPATFSLSILLLQFSYLRSISVMRNGVGKVFPGHHIAQEFNKMEFSPRHLLAIKCIV